MLSPPCGEFYYIYYIKEYFSLRLLCICVCISVCLCVDGTGVVLCTCVYLSFLLFTFWPIGRIKWPGYTYPCLFYHFENLFWSVLREILQQIIKRNVLWDEEITVFKLSWKEVGFYVRWDLLRLKDFRDLSGKPEDKVQSLQRRHLWEW